MQRRLGSLFGGLLVLLAIAYVLHDAWAWQHAVDVVDSGFRKLASSETNEHPGAIYLESDSYYWLSYARRIAAGETWRVRDTHNDNTPSGRPVHWSQSISWLLVVFGKTRQFVTGEPWDTAMERASAWINPLLLVLLVGAITAALWRRLGLLPCGLFAAFLVTLGDVEWEFQPLRPDHQSLQALFGVLMLAGLVIGGAGWIRAHRTAPDSTTEPPASRSLEVPGAETARRWFIVSAVCAGLSLWVSAVVAIMLLVMLFCAGLLLAYSAPKLGAESEIVVAPELWRLWGRIGGLVSFLMYLVEYFPNHLEFHLEINGPLYSVALAAIGEGLCQFLKARYAEASPARAHFAKGVICVAIVAIVPLAIFFGPVSWHALKDPEMRRLHDFIQEFYSFPRFAGDRFYAIIVENFGILPLFFVVAVILAAFTNLRLLEWAVLWLSFAVTLGVLILGYLQVRWLGLYAGMNAWLALVTAVSAWRLLQAKLPEAGRFVAGLILCALLLIQPVRFALRSIAQLDAIATQRTLPREVANPVLNKRLALALRAQEGARLNVMADPDFVPALQYFGGGEGVVAFYWEDMDGLHDATKFLADTGSDAARAVALQRHLTHVVVQVGNRLQTYFYYIANGKVDQEAATKIFAARLMGSEFELPPRLQTTPALQQIGTQLYTYGGMRFEESWRIYRIAP